MFLKHFCISNSNFLLKHKRRKISHNNFTVVNYLFSISLSANNSSSIVNSSSVVSGSSIATGNSIVNSSNNLGHSTSDISSYVSTFHFHTKHTIDHAKNLKKLTLNKSHMLKKRLHHCIAKWDLRMTSNFKVKKKITNYYKAKVKKKGAKLIYIYLKYITHLYCYGYSKKYLNIQKLLNCVRNRKETNVRKIDVNRNFSLSNQEIVLSEKVKRHTENPLELSADTHEPSKKHAEKNVKNENERSTQTEPPFRKRHEDQLKDISESSNTDPNAEWKKFRKKKREHETDVKEREPKKDRYDKKEILETNKKNRQHETEGVNEKRDTNEKKGNTETNELNIREIIEKEERFVDEKTEAKSIKMNDLLLVGLSGCIPFICFGFVDNSFMIIAGDLFDSTFCIFLGFSTMAAAGLGNLTSDVLGIFLGGYIEKLIAYIGFPKINMTNKQLKMSRTRRYYYLGSAVGIAIGCLLGMIPLLFIDSHKLEEKKKNKRMKCKNTNKALFDLVSKKLPQHMNSKHAFLFIVDKSKNNFYSIFENKKIQLPLDNECVLTEVYKKGKTIAYEISNHLINNSYLYKPNINQEEEKIIDASGKNKEHEKEVRIIENTNSLFSKHNINVEHVLAAPLFDIDQSVIAVIVVINPMDPICSNSKYIHFLNLLCSHISHEVKEETDISQTLQLCKRVVYE